MDNARYKPDGRKRYTTWLWCGILYLVTWYCSADEINLYSINTGSYVYHLTHNHGQYTENFENNFISVERKFSDDSKYSFVLGTMKNSFDDRCLAAGVRRDWVGWDNGWVFKGIYGYVGEFFFDAFSDCGDHGSYHDFKKATGIGFSPISIMGSSIILHLILGWMLALSYRQYLSLRHSGVLDKIVVRKRIFRK
jgi:hypothetical protein